MLSIDKKTGEIKFRVFHKPTSTLQYVAEISFVNQYVSTYGSFWKNKIIEGEPIYGIPLSECDLMQSIDIKDCCGDDIYEGDILSFDDSEVGGPKGIAEVTYCTDYTIISVPGFYIFGNGFYSSFPCHCKIIGNIYENPELLK